MSLGLIQPKHDRNQNFLKKICNCNVEKMSSLRLHDWLFTPPAVRLAKTDDGIFLIFWHQIIFEDEFRR